MTSTACLRRLDLSWEMSLNGEEVIRANGSRAFIKYHAENLLSWIIIPFWPSALVGPLTAQATALNSVSSSTQAD